MPDEITTVLGDKRRDHVKGPVLAHEHLRYDLRLTVPNAEPDRYLLEDDAVVEELVGLREKWNVGLILELTMQDEGRNADFLRGSSQRSGIDIVCATGFYHEQYHPPRIKDASVEELMQEFARDVTEGIDGTDVRAGVIGEMGSAGLEMTSAEKRCFKAAARAALLTGVSVTTHAHFGVGAMEQLQVLADEGLPPERICIGHQDLIAAPAQHRAIAEAGAYVAFDTFGKNHYQPDEVRLQLVLKMIEAGHASRVLLSTDLSRKGHLKKYGGFGYAHVFEYALPKLREAGVDEDTISLIMEENLMRLLAKREPKRA
jgi:phosphotriesterase-related protein